MNLGRDRFRYAYYGSGRRDRKEYNLFSMSILKNSSFIALSMTFRYGPILKMHGISSLYCVILCTKYFATDDLAPNS